MRARAFRRNRFAPDDPVPLDPHVDLAMILILPIPNMMFMDTGEVKSHWIPIEA
jgi:hypothetical protein